MSTCPDFELYSTYLDGEVPSPWDEQIRQHLHTCNTCQEKLEQYRKIQRYIHTDIIPHLDEELSYKRVLLKRKTLAYTDRTLVTENDGKLWFQKTIQIPAPLAVAAAVLLVVFLPVVFWVQSAQSPVYLHDQDFQPILPAALGRTQSTEVLQNRYISLFNANTEEPALTRVYQNSTREDDSYFRVSEFAALYLYGKRPTALDKEISIRLPVSDFVTLQGFTADYTKNRIDISEKK